MLQSTYSVQQQAGYEERAPDLAHYFRLARRRLFYFLIPFLVLLTIGLLIVAIQRPIYLAEGKVLVESQDIPVDLVRPTVTDTANQRIQVIQQRIMTRDNLLAIVNKYGLFTTQRRWMSGSELLDLMRERTTLELVDLNSIIAAENKKKTNQSTAARPMLPQQSNLTIALTLGFEYENPEIAMRVANEFLTLVLSEDARNRANRAAETTKFLARELKRLEGELGAIDAQVAELRRTAAPRTLGMTSDPTVMQMATLKAELAQKSSIYSDSHPEVKALKRKIAIFQQSIEKTPPPAANQPVAGLEELEKQREGAQKNVDEASRKLAAARLGESLEKDQQSERLQVIEQPALPQTPVRPHRVKLAAAAFAVAMAVGLGFAFVTEALDKSIHSGQELLRIVDKDLIVSIPYITTAEEIRRKRRRAQRTWGIVASILLVGFCLAYYLGLSIDLSDWLDRVSTDTLRSWLDALRRLGK
jgi:uncharacterized protein involved in exopolysaccharide biosynthesis